MSRSKSLYLLKNTHRGCACFYQGKPHSYTQTHPFTKTGKMEMSWGWSSQIEILAQMLEAKEHALHGGNFSEKDLEVS